MDSSYCYHEYYFLFSVTASLIVKNMNRTNILAIIIPITLIVLAIGGAVGYFFIRQRRISNNFTQFANSHYDTRRGQATFPGTGDVGIGNYYIYKTIILMEYRNQRISNILNFSLRFN